MITLALATSQQIAAAFKWAGLDEVSRYHDAESSIEMARALKQAGYRGVEDDRGVIQAVK